ncbi:MAG: hypothetical protein CL678_12005 [Bdellovibrionaceae bacterium]|nr:hypothetical protein [Pseudobdellovibrionaceae bacterium]
MKQKRPQGRDIPSLVQVLERRLRALTVCLSHSWGGLEQVAAADSVELAKLGLSVSVLVLEGSPIHENLAGKEGINIIPLSYRPRDFLDFKLKRELQKLCPEDGSGINLIHCHQPSLLGSILPWLWRRKDVVVVASRHIMNHHNKRNPYHALLFRRLDALIVMSHALKKNVLETHPLRERQVKVIHLGIRFDQFDPEKIDPRLQRERWGVSEHTTVVGMVGRIDPAKGQSTLLRAAAGLQVRKKEHIDFKFVIVGEETLGSSSNHLEELQEMVIQYGLQDSVVFAGYQDNIPEVMRAFDIFVMPSKEETFGLVAIEAMAMECPIVISRGGSADEIVGEEEFGLLIRPQDAFDLQRQISYLLDNPLDRVKMGINARNHVMNEYDRLGRIQRTLMLYERLLRRRRGVS